MKYNKEYNKVALIFGLITAIFVLATIILVSIARFQIWGWIGLLGKMSPYCWVQVLKTTCGKLGMATLIGAHITCIIAKVNQ